MAAKKKADRFTNYIRFMINKYDLRVGYLASEAKRRAMQMNSNAPVITGT